MTDLLNQTSAIERIVTRTCGSRLHQIVETDALPLAGQNCASPSAIALAQYIDVTQSVRRSAAVPASAATVTAHSRPDDDRSAPGSVITFASRRWNAADARHRCSVAESATTSRAPIWIRLLDDADTDGGVVNVRA